jgi:hypothetical protein
MKPTHTRNKGTERVQRIQTAHWVGKDEIEKTIAHRLDLGDSGFTRKEVEKHLRGYIYYEGRSWFDNFDSLFVSREQMNALLEEAKTVAAHLFPDFE